MSDLTCTEPGPENEVGNCNAVDQKGSSKEADGMEFLWRNPTRSYQREKFTEKQLKDFLLNQSVRLELFFFIIAGLPFSGKTTLVNSIFDLPKRKRTLSDLDLHEAIIYSQKMFGESTWFESSQIQIQVTSILVAFAQYFARERKLPCQDLKEKLNFDGMFNDPEIQGYFKTISTVLLEPVFNIDNEKKIERMIYSSLSLVNVFDVGVNKAVYEFMKAIGGRNKHLVLVNVLDLFRSDRETMMKPLDLADSKYPEKYADSQVSLFKERSALHHLVSNMEAASLSKPQATGNTLIVGTHADQFQSQPERAKREKEMRDILDDYCTRMGYKSDYLPKMVTVDATDKRDCKKVQDALSDLINNKDFSIDLPVRFIFLRYVLSCTKRVYMSREDLNEYAKKCEFKDESEVDCFLKVYRDCASIFSFSDKKHFLHNWVILLPIKFMRDLDKLYCLQDDQTIPAEQKAPAQYGILSVHVLKALWQGLDEKPMPTWEFNVHVLKSVHLLLELEHGKYFCPSLRLKHSDGPLHPSSLIISSSAAFTSFSHMQCAFLKRLTGYHADMMLRLDEECPYYNCVEFLSKSTESEGRVSIRFFHDFIEVFVDPSNTPPSHAAILYSILKTNCVAIMNEISTESSYKFSVTCPSSRLEPLSSHCHFVHFDILDTSGENLQCTMCNLKFNEVEGIHWVKAAYQGTRRAAVQAGDVMNPTNLLSICKEHLSSLTIHEIETLSKKLMVSNELKAISHAPVDEVLFHVLYSWYCKNPTATKRKLALLLKDCNLYSQAVALDPKLFTRTKSSVTIFSSKEVTILASSWTEDPEELAEVLEMPIADHEEGATDTEKCSSMLQLWLDQTEGDRREKLASKFAEKEYHTMASYVSELPI